MVGIPTTNEMTKNDLCQEKLALRNLFTVDSFRLEKSNNMVRLFLYLTVLSAEGYMHQISVPHSLRFRKAARCIIHVLQRISNRI